MKRRELLKGAALVAFGSLLPSLPTLAEPLPVEPVMGLSAKFFRRGWTKVEAEIADITTMADSYRRFMPTGILRADLVCGHSTKIDIIEFRREWEAAHDKEDVLFTCYECPPRDLLL